MINPRSMAVLIRDRAANQFEDKTRDVSEIRTEGQRIEIVFIRSNKTFGYGRDRVRILCNPRRRLSRSARCSRSGRSGARTKNCAT